MEKVSLDSKIKKKKEAEQQLELAARAHPVAGSSREPDEDGVAPVSLYQQEGGHSSKAWRHDLNRIIDVSCWATMTSTKEK
mmetsp:Transcript_17749/g.44368  ORF Transcript_17749/g.44368 Transcript_17749/m.44368 type:complete len:81 (-) Transcript_17749:480-722(-)